MGLFLNVALVTIAFLYAVTAFGGETWLKDNRPLLQRITSRGWICVGLLFLTLGIGAGKEVRNYEGEKLLKGERDTAKTQLQDVQKQSQAANFGIGEARLSLGEAQTRLQDAQGKLQATQSQLSDAQGRLVDLQRQGQTTYGRLQDAQGRLQDAQGRLLTLQSQAITANEHLLKANKSIAESREVVDRIAVLSDRIDKVGIMTALSRSQKDLTVDVHVPIDPITPAGSPTPTHLIDLLFPKWPELTTTDEKELMIYLRVESRRKHMIGDLWGFRKDPYDIKLHGLAVKDPDGTEHSLKMFGQAALAFAGEKTFLHSTFSFPTAQVPAAWFSEFKQGTRIFQAGIRFRGGLAASQVATMERLWNRMFQDGGTIRIPVLDHDSFFLEYDIKKESLAVEDNWLRVTYSISSRPRLITENL